MLPAQQHGQQPKQWIDIDIQLKDTEGNVTSETTLVVRNDNLYVKGFKNRKREWFELCGPEETGKEKLPGEDYMAEELVGWGVTYSGIMGLKGAKQVKRTLKTARLGKAFAERAVRRLSCYPDNEYNDDMPVRLGLAGLSVMICEAARMDPFLRHFAGSQDDNSQGGAWDLEMRLEDEKMFVFMWNWKNMSAALLKRKGSLYSDWDSGCGVDSEEAIACVHLVLNSSYEVTRSGGAHVEILDVFVNFPVREIKFIDEAQQISRNIYTQKTDDSNNQGDNVMHRLELTVPGKCITGHKWFSMEVVTPASTGDGKEFKWDCRKQAGGDATEFVVRKIDLNSGSHLDSSDKVEVTYLVMSNAVKATVEVKLRLQDEKPTLPHEKDGGGGTAATAMEDVNKYTAQGKKDGGGCTEYTAHGKITAHIGGFEGHPIVLFERSVEKRITLEPSALIFPLDRSTIHVPRGKELQIDMSRLDTGPKVDKKPGKVRFPFGKSRSDDIAGNDSAFPVDVGWDLPYEPKPDAVFTIGDKKFTDFIDEVCKVFAGQKFELLQPSVEAPDDGKLFLTSPRPTNGQPEQWIHIELRVERLSTTLAVQDGRCYVVGFMNQSQVWYDLGCGNQRRDNKVLPPEYNSVLLGWGLSYDEILGLTVTGDWDKVYRELNKDGLGKKSFAEKAVRTLSRYPDVDEDDLNPRVALAGLIIMVCESARFNPLLKYFQDNWDNDTKTNKVFSLEEMMKYIWSWGRISRALLLWNDNGEWPQDPILNKRGITDEGVALAAVRLVYSEARTLEFLDDGICTTDEFGVK